MCRLVCSKNLSRYGTMFCKICSCCTPMISGCNKFVSMDMFIICKWGKLLNTLMELGNNINRFTEALPNIQFNSFIYNYFNPCSHGKLLLRLSNSIKAKQIYSIELCFANMWYDNVKKQAGARLCQDLTLERKFPKFKQDSENGLKTMSKYGFSIYI